jgi:hypothetical protein
MSPAGNHAHAMVPPAEAGSGSVAAFTQDLRPGLILFRPDGLVPARSPALGRVGQIPRQMLCRPRGTRVPFLLHPPLKRWAILFRARGAGVPLGRG